MMKWIVILLLLCFAGFRCLCLRNVRMRIPIAVQRGHPTVFECLFDMTGDTLYSVRWYKGNREFYRFTPANKPPIKIFPLHGISINAKRSNATHLVLNPVDAAVGGRYSCEVSADAPTFHTSIVTGETKVVELPKQTPIISGIKPKYRLGDILRSNCTSGESRPAANLTWYINGELANPEYVKPFHKFATKNGNLETSQIGVRLTINRDHFENDRLKIRCIASMYNIYWKSVEKSVDEERPKLSINNAVTPNTLGVNQQPSSFENVQQRHSYFDEDFPTEIRHHHLTNNVRHNLQTMQFTTQTAPINSAPILAGMKTEITVVLVLLKINILINEY